jgi:hypothetical protein
MILLVLVAILSCIKRDRRYLMDTCDMGASITDLGNGDLETS